MSPFIRCHRKGRRPYLPKAQGDVQLVLFSLVISRLVSLSVSIARTSMVCFRRPVQSPGCPSARGSSSQILLLSFGSLVHLQYAVGGLVLSQTAALPIMSGSERENNHLQTISSGSFSFSSRAFFCEHRCAYSERRRVHSNGPTTNADCLHQQSLRA